MMERRFESYKAHVVRPLFREHFSRLDRQIVLVDVLGPLNEGNEAVADLQRALDAVLRVFRTGASTWLNLLVGRHIDKLLFAATKADHINSSSHDRLEAILRVITQRAMGRASAAGAEVGVQALAALRATRETDAKVGNEWLPCIVGVPMPGERVGGRVFEANEARCFGPAARSARRAEARRGAGGSAFRALPAAAAPGAGSRWRGAPASPYSS
jgi:predicted YcjX-like family ATPase